MSKTVDSAGRARYQRDVPFIIIYEAARRDFSITRDEYALCHYVHFRSADPRSQKPGWCDDTKGEIAGFIGITRRGVYKMIDRLIRFGLLNSDPPTGFLQITPAWIDRVSQAKEATNRREQSSHRSNQQREQSSHRSAHKVHTEREQSNHAYNRHKGIDSKKVKEGRGAHAEIEPLDIKTTLQSGDIPAGGENSTGAGPLISFGDRPGARTAGNLVAAMREFYVNYPGEWEAGVLDGAKAKTYSPTRQTEIVTAWAAHVIKNNHGSDTYQMLNADLQAWFLRQREFDRAKPAADQPEPVNRLRPLKTA